MKHRGEQNSQHFVRTEILIANLTLTFNKHGTEKPEQSDILTKLHEKHKPEPESTDSHAQTFQGARGL